MTADGLAGRTYIVTAANSGIGKNVVETLLRNGAHVIATVREGRLLEVFHERLEIIYGDLGSLADCQSLVSRAATSSRISGLVHVAGAWVPGDIAAVDEAAFDYAFSANVKTAFNICKPLIPELEKNEGGSIVTISSMLGLSPVPNSILYASAKAALIQFTRALALDLGPKGIRCNCICPGLIKTAQTANVFDQPEWVERIVQSYPVGRLGEPRDVGEVTAFLLSNSASWITGLALPVEGGYLISAEAS
ncbi:SDR family oxidoreductase [Rhizobium sp. C104]|uniref:SDR family NAD(P)-dependent oxidoreductase n=1 Tax=Rhizobium sp. C104 TaxID=2917727 RepID=UPI001EF77AB6|nr:SDR family oxidoreductase [Rhizobium sp. C104]ULJ77367.1 SDR family oxidoreductase [Rhizobium sp. C104]